MQWLIRQQHISTDVDNSITLPPPLPLKEMTHRHPSPKNTLLYFAARPQCSVRPKRNISPLIYVGKRFKPLKLPPLNKEGTR